VLLPPAWKARHERFGAITTVGLAMMGADPTLRWHGGEQAFGTARRLKVGFDSDAGRTL
jgi:hypothetical protein